MLSLILKRAPEMLLNDMFAALPANVERILRRPVPVAARPEISRSEPDIVDPAENLMVSAPDTQAWLLQWANFKSPFVSSKYTISGKPSVPMVMLGVLPTTPAESTVVVLLNAPQEDVAHFETFKAEFV